MPFGPSLRATETHPSDFVVSYAFSGILLGAFGPLLWITFTRGLPVPWWHHCLAIPIGFLLAWGHASLTWSPERQLQHRARKMFIRYYCYAHPLSIAATLCYYWLQ